MTYFNIAHSFIHFIWIQISRFCNILASFCVFSSKQVNKYTKNKNLMICVQDMYSFLTHPQNSFFSSIFTGRISKSVLQIGDFHWQLYFLRSLYFLTEDWKQPQRTSKSTSEILIYMWSWDVRLKTEFTFISKQV